MHPLRLVEYTKIGAFCLILLYFYVSIFVLSNKIMKYENNEYLHTKFYCNNFQIAGYNTPFNTLFCSPVKWGIERTRDRYILLFIKPTYSLAASWDCVRHYVTTSTTDNIDWKDMKHDLWCRAKQLEVPGDARHLV